MKVTGQQPPRAQELQSGKSREAESQPQRKPEQAAEVAAPAGNRTSLTMNRIREVIRNTPDVRADRVEAVRERIRSGEYKVDAEGLAHRMINEALRDDLERS